MGYNHHSLIGIVLFLLSFIQNINILYAEYNNQESVPKSRSIFSEDAWKSDNHRRRLLNQSQNSSNQTHSPKKKSMSDYRTLRTMLLLCGTSAIVLGLLVCAYVYATFYEPNVIDPSIKCLNDDDEDDNEYDPSQLNYKIIDDGNNNNNTKNKTNQVKRNRFSSFSRAQKNAAKLQNNLVTPKTTDNVKQQEQSEIPSTQLLSDPNPEISSTNNPL